MRLCTLRLDDGGTCAAILDADRLIHLPAADVGALLRTDGWRERVLDTVRAAGRTTDPATADYAPVVVDPRKIICCGQNFRAHIAEMGRAEPEYPTLFTKFADTLTGPNDDITVTAYAEDLDWEAELAVVVGAPIFHADRQQAAAAIAGYTVANDFSVRSWQRRTLQWLQGKAFDSTTPLGPLLVTADEFDPGAAHLISCHVNGVRRQHGSTDDLLFDSAALLSYITAFTALRPGDVVLTGTPGGVGAGAQPPVFLADGDVVETAIEGIGQQRNRIRIKN
ncbi:MULTISPECIES: fumarylacetoacetate hydrolase family protein [unclassified Nocardia]|uniref:fumarylacetoacetate hydrolase family protein n=1 Tax=unclassified Nocardia TaxID=2637762 RepID=UPI001CE3B891|nr:MULTISPECIES: fumarylacetoacetate hydrolase family protein [unclassified Nocardia]